MITRYKNRAIVGIASAVVLSVYGEVMARWLPRRVADLAATNAINVAARFTATAFFVWSGYMLAKAKGLPRSEGAWGFLGVVGLFVLACMKDRSKPPQENAQRGFEVLPARNQTCKAPPLNPETIPPPSALRKNGVQDPVVTKGA